MSCGRCARCWTSIPGTRGSSTASPARTSIGRRQPSPAGLPRAPYHAGMPDDERRRNQEAFITDRVDVIVATVAFGMGIDKSNVRYVIHAGMPKSLETYQQESGRAGRDGLDAECWLFFSSQDYMVWKRIIDDSPQGTREGSLKSLAAMTDFCNSVQCRHQAIVEHFGQVLDGESCDACDVCLGQLELVDDPLTIGQQILSCVVRLQQRYGGEYTAKVLHGSQEQRFVQRGHHQLSTWGLLRQEALRTIRDWIEQLVSQGFLVKHGEYNQLSVTPEGRRLLHGERVPRLLRPAQPSPLRRLAEFVKRIRGQGSTVACLMNCAACGTNWPRHRMYRPLSSSVTPQCAIWRGSDRQRSTPFARFGVSAKKSGRTTVGCSSTASPPIATPMNWPWTCPLRSHLPLTHRPRPTPPDPTCLPSAHFRCSAKGSVYNR